MYYKLKYADKLTEIDENTLNNFENLITQIQEDIPVFKMLQL